MSDKNRFSIAIPSASQKLSQRIPTQNVKFRLNKHAVHSFYDLGSLNANLCPENPPIPAARQTGVDKPLHAGTLEIQARSQLIVDKLHSILTLTMTLNRHSIFLSVAVLKEPNGHVKREISTFK